METFEVGTACCWSCHKFDPDERGMKCLTCGKVMTNDAWEEKRQCFLGHTNAVPAIASNSTSSIRLGNSRLSSEPPRQPRPEISWRPPPFPTPVPPSHPRRQLNWRDAPPPVSPPRPRQTRRRHELRWREPKTSALQKWQIFVMLVIVVCLAVVAIALLTQ